jgi:hypothetical protein
LISGASQTEAKPHHRHDQEQKVKSFYAQVQHVESQNVESQNVENQNVDITM